MPTDPSRLRRWLVAYSVAFFAVYVPLETLVTIEIAGLSGLHQSGYVMEWPAFVMVVLGAWWADDRRPFATGLLTAGWSWMAVTFWRATSDRFRFAALSGGLSGQYWGAGKGGNLELVIACMVTALGCLGTLWALRLLYLQTRSGPT